MKSKEMGWVSGKMKTVVLAGLLLLLFAAMGGCANTIVPEQVQAIEMAIQQRAESTEAFYYFAYDDLTPQVEAALEEEEKRLEEYQYTIEVWTVDVKKLPEDKLEIPEVSYTIHTAPNTYVAAYVEKLTDIIEDYIVTQEPEALQRAELTVKLKRVEKVWEAEFLDAGFTRICNTYKTDIANKADSMAIATEGYQVLQFTGEVKTEIGDALRGTQYEDAWELTSVDKDGNGYTVTIEYPDFTEQLEQAADKGYHYYAEQGKRYSELAASSAQSKILELLSSTDAAAPALSVTLELTDVGAVSEELQKVTDAFDALCTEKASSVAGKVNQELVHQTQELPGTKVLSGNNSGQTIRVETSADLYDLHLTFYALSGTDLSEDGTKTLSAYIKAGDSLTVYLPTGNYKLVQGHGEDWYGDELSFGPNGSYTVSDILMQIEYGYEYTLTLYGVVDGNFPTKNIPFPYAA